MSDWTPEEYQSTISTANLSAGIYILELVTDTMIYRLRMAVQ